MTFLSWRRELVLAAVDRLLEAQPEACCAAPGRGMADGDAAAAWERLQADLATNLPPQEILAALEELLSSRRHHCHGRQLGLIEVLRQQAPQQLASLPFPRA